MTTVTIGSWLLNGNYLLAADSPSIAPASSMWDLVLKGGWIMIPIGACSLLALTIVVERVLMLRKGRILPPTLVSSLTTLRDNPHEAAKRCAADASPAAMVLAAAIKSRGEPRAERERIIEEAGARQVVKLRQRMRVLSSLPQIATMLGLLGTVMGMIRTFTVVAASGESLGKTERLAQGIYEAWTATAAGLLVAIPVLLCYHALMSRIDGSAALLDRVASEWLDAEENPAPAPVLHKEVHVPETASNGVAMTV